MFTGELTLNGINADIVWRYHKAAELKTWTLQRSEFGYWTMAGQLRGSYDPFILRQRGLDFVSPRKGGYYVFPIIGVPCVVGNTLSAAVGAPLQ